MFEEIKRELTAVIEDIKSNLSSEWTRDVKNSLEKLAARRGLDCRRTDRTTGKAENWEFLCDVVWLETQRGLPRDKNGYFVDGRRIKRCVLACEIEWNGKRDVRDPIYDFSKLLLMKAEYLLFVGEAVDASTRDWLLREMKAALDACQAPPPSGSVLVGIHTRGEKPAIEFFHWESVWKAM